MAVSKIISILLLLDLCKNIEDGNSSDSVDNKEKHKHASKTGHFLSFWHPSAPFPLKIMDWDYTSNKMA